MSRSDSNTEYDVRVGDVYQENDIRSWDSKNGRRTLRVVRLNRERALVENTVSGRQTWVSLQRLSANRTDRGYELIERETSNG